MAQSPSRRVKRLRRALAREKRLCLHCHSYPHPSGADACLGILPGVQFACCGHGGAQEESAPYVSFRVEQLSADARLRAYIRKAPAKDKGLFKVRLPGLKRPVHCAIYGKTALQYFDELGLGPTHQPAQLWLPLWSAQDEDAS